MDQGYISKIKIPAKPGVYFFLGTKKEILYIGKATSLNQRIKSYFSADIKEKRSTLIEKMVVEAKTIEWVTTDSVLEAMLLETNLIRIHKPNYNTRSKDDKSFNHVVITKELYPRVLVMRGKDLLLADASKEYLRVYGPFPNGVLFREALKIIRKLFKFYDTHVPIGDKITHGVVKGKIDFNRQIGLYPESCTPEEYMQTINHICLFFEGKKDQIIEQLQTEMFACARREEFEKANTIKKKIFALMHIQDISLLKDESRLYKDDRSFRIEAYDVAHLSGTDMVGVMTVFDGNTPVKSEYRKFSINGFIGVNDPRALEEVLTRRFSHSEWTRPDCIVVDGSTAQKNVALKVLKHFGIVVPVICVVKDERHKPVRVVGPAKLIKEHEAAILHANAESHRFAITFHRSKRAQSLKRS